ncbi:MAG: hypothetical protein KDB10_15135 [Acidimicrobiales bacterium]|nr:hypothetical protein [Acidimicrobiales bacterium]MCB9372477.1 hypothetical protein [Microthrixaceae bacterium]
MDEPSPDRAPDGSGVVLAAEAVVAAAALAVDLDAVAADLDGVDAALRRLDDGTYGTCEVCTVALDDEVLAADPVARRCAAHLEAPTLPGTAAPGGPEAVDPPPSGGTE